MKKDQTKFEEKFCEALGASLRGHSVDSKLKDRILKSLESASKTPAESLACEPQASEFECRLSQAVAESCEWAPSDEVILRTQSELSKELEQDLFDERAVIAYNALPEAEKDEYSAPSDKAKFLESWIQHFRESVSGKKLPDALREQILARLAEDGLGKGLAGKGQVIAFPSRPIIRRALGAVASLAAGFAFLVVTLFTSADQALANSVRADHQKCCRAAMASPAPAQPLKEMLDSKFGQVPVAPLDPSWELRVSQVCRNSSGQPMIHLLYAKTVDGKAQTLSFHYIPEAKGSEPAERHDGIRQLTQDEFPVLAWTEGQWTCTACSPDLDAASLKKAVKAL